MKLRAYRVSPDENEAMCDIAIAETAKEAKKMAWNQSDWIQDQAIDGYTDLKVKWLRNANITGLSKGLVTPDIESLRRNMFSWIEYLECPVCGKKDTRVELWEYGTDDNNEEAFIACSDCSEKYEEGDLTVQEMPKKSMPYDLEGKR